MSVAPSTVAAPFQLRLFSPDELRAADVDSHGLSPGMSLSDFYRKFVAEIWLKERGADPKTLAIYRQAIDHWARHTGDPPLDEIDDFTTCRFSAALADAKGRKAEKLAEATRHKLIRSVQTCLYLAGPKTPRHRKAQRLIDEVPYLEKPELERREGIEDNFTLPEIAAILRAADRMTEPSRDPFQRRFRDRENKTWRRVLTPGTGIAPATYWRSLVAFTYNTGERKSAVFGAPQPTTAAEEIKFAAKTRKGKKRTNTVWLNGAAVLAIESIRTDRMALFPWPNDPRTFYTRWKQLLTLAGIPKERQFGLHGLRKATATEAAAYSPMGAQQILGHADGTLLQRHYVARTLKRDALEKLPQPQ